MGEADHPADHSAGKGRGAGAKPVPIGPLQPWKLMPTAQCSTADHTLLLTGRRPQTAIVQLLPTACAGNILKVLYLS